jgi:CDGSH iron-sulfur domain-containing protein 3
MPVRVIAGRAPIVLELEPGTYWWCSCGRSKDQPFCDGSHEGPPHTGCAPVEFTIRQRQRVALCLCKHSRNGPICDGFHKFLPPE